jgi:hypothetical protein
VDALTPDQLDALAEITAVIRGRLAGGSEKSVAEGP